MSIDTGTIDGATHTRLERVYFEHTDFSGVVYHARYLDFLEHARSDYVRMLDVHHAELSAGAYGESLAFAVRAMAIEYLGAARIDDVLRVETDRGRLEGARLVFDQRIFRDGALILRATVTVVMVNAAGRPRRFPPFLLDRLGVARRAT